MIVRLILDELPPGLNGSDGLIREHWALAAKRKRRYQLKIMSQSRHRFQGPVNIAYIRYASRLMDWDNCAASAKHVLDGIKDAGIITDDNPSIVVRFFPVQRKCKQKESHVEIIICDEEDYEYLKSLL